MPSHLYSPLFFLQDHGLAIRDFIEAGRLDPSLPTGPAIDDIVRQVNGLYDIF